MPTVITQGAASAKGYGFGASSTAANYIEDVFSTYLYTGTGASQTITNGVDLSGKGGLVWMKGRSGATAHALYDTARGATFDLVSSTTAAQTTQSTGLTAFGSTGFTIGALAKINTSAATYASWVFRKQAKFFDIVTYTGTGANRTVAHNLGSVPGCIIIKATSTTGDWITYHRSLGNTDFVRLNTTGATAADSGAWNNTTPTSTVFSLGTGNTNVNGVSYVAYLFAHNAGGFGAAGTDNVISCGSFTTNANGDLSLNLGWEPQWLVLKTTSAVGPWYQYDIMRGLPVTASSSSRLSLNTSAAEVAGAESIYPTPTGLTATGQLNPNTTYIYIAIRRGPMKTPTSGTSVFSPNTSSAASGTKITTNFPVDAQLGSDLVGTSNRVFVDRLRGISTNATGAGQTLLTNSTAVEAADTGSSLFWDNTGFQMNANFGGAAAVFWSFRRAPGFFDEVCYTGTGANRTVSHNLGVAPELMIVKNRSSATNWIIYSSALGATKYLIFDIAAASTATAIWNDTAPTASVFTVGTSGSTNGNTENHVAYLFATCPGVSKVGSYTGSGTTKQIDCGFTGGARFVLIKRTDSTGDWYLWDSARGIVAGNDPYVLINSNVAEVTITDYIDTYSAGFELSTTALTTVNVLNGTYIFLAIA